MAQIDPDIVVHLAGNVSVKFSVENPLVDFRINALGTAALVTSVLKTRCSNFVYVTSAGAIYGDSTESPATEQSPTKPLSPYGLSKLVGEQYLRLLAKNRMNWTSLAISNCYGPINLQQQGLIFSFWQDINRGIRPKIFGPRVTRDFIFYEDVLDAILLTLETSVNNRINISSGVSHSLLQVFSMVKDIMNSDWEPEILPKHQNDVSESCIDNSLAKEFLGWSPQMGLFDGLKLSLEISS